jgi:hypothetical protein
MQDIQNRTYELKRLACETAVCALPDSAQIAQLRLQRPSADGGKNAQTCAAALSRHAPANEETKRRSHVIYCCAQKTF